MAVSSAQMGAGVHVAEGLRERGARGRRATGTSLRRVPAPSGVTMAACAMSSTVTRLHVVGVRPELVTSWRWYRMAGREANWLRAILLAVSMEIVEC